ncbi:cellulose biosynthesis protein BcsP [Undibacterium sp. TC4M20W]|uniref:cellulose biosynthesis protein BcsP n=1 Tax=Undibacterium sp. TC4M20W TaxID=3413052 RepID=UPI003BF25523
MDDDVKNLFQKFGQSTDAYREINRDADSEQAKQRWPLLRDVHLHSAAPAVAPVRARHREEDLATPVPSNDSPFRPAAAKPAAARSVAVKTSSLQAAPEVHAGIKHSSQLPLKQMLMQNVAPEEQEAEPETEPETASPFLSKILPTANKQSTGKQKEAGSTGLFSARAQTPAPEAQAATPGIAAFAGTRKPVGTVAPSAATVIHSLPAAHAIPMKQAHEAAEEPRNQTVKSRPAAKDQAVSAVFGRLAGKQEEAKPADTGSNSFFKKIFKP